MTITLRIRTWQLVALTLLLSLIVHFLGGLFAAYLAALFAHFVPAPKVAGPIVPPETITLDHRPPPPPPRVPAHVQARVKPLPPPPPPQSTATRVLPKPRPVEQIAHGAPQQPRKKNELTHIVKQAPHVVALGKITGYHQETTSGEKSNQLSAAQIAALNDKFSQTISDSHTDVESVAKSVGTTPTYTMKHYTTAFSSGVSGLRAGDGTIEAISRERRGNTMWYYTHYRYRYADGHIEEDDIPWPFHYPINDDPFARHDLRIPLQAPPDGFVPNRPLKPILEQFFGGPPPPP
jgi:hypothetical protein